MNPNLSGLMQSLQGAPESAPTGGLSSGNPFAGLIKGFGPKGQEQAPVQAPAQAPSQPGSTPNVQKSDLQPETITGGTPFLVNAIQDLQNYIKNSQDSGQIVQIRSVIKLLSVLVQNDQDTQAKVLQ